MHVWASVTALILAAALAYAGAPATQDRDNAPPGGARPTIILPIEYTGQHIFVVLSDERSRPLTLLLDTGFENSALSPAAAGGRQIVWLGTTRLTGYGAKPVERWHGSAGLVLSAGQATVFEGPIMVLDLEFLRRGLGRPVDGILGWDIFSQWCATLDIAARQLILRDRSACAPPGDAQPAIQSEWLPHGLLLASTITFADGRKTGALLHLDTGCDTTLVLNSQFRSVSGVERPGATINLIGSFGVNGMTLTDGVTISSVEFDGGAVRIPAATDMMITVEQRGGLFRGHWWNLGFKEARVTRDGLFRGHWWNLGFKEARVSRDGLLGTGLIERFVWTFDPQGKQVYVTPRAVDSAVADLTR
jgi:hypothetical protein